MHLLTYLLIADRTGLGGGSLAVNILRTPTGENVGGINYSRPAIHKTSVLLFRRFNSVDSKRTNAWPAGLPAA